MALALAGVVGLSAAASAQQYNWSGLYFGANSGAAWGNVDWQYAAPAGPPGAVSQGVHGPLVGGHIGLQHQIQRFVVGIDAAYAGSAYGAIDGLGPDAPTFAATYNAYARINSILQIGPRIGYVVHPQWMIYGTGGFARAAVTTADIDRFTKLVNVQDRQWHDGWFLGAGFEYALSPNVTVGLEYVHYEFDSVRHAAANPVVFGVTRDVEADADVVRGRVSFKLDRVSAPTETLK